MYEAVAAGCIPVLFDDRRRVYFWNSASARADGETPRGVGSDSGRAAPEQGVRLAALYPSDRPRGSLGRVRRDVFFKKVKRLTGALRRAGAR